MLGDPIIPNGVDHVVHEPEQQRRVNGANGEHILNIRREPDLPDDTDLTVLGRSRKRSIYRVPALLKDLNRKAYEPQMVSFGPYHYGKEHLMPMKKYKQNVLLHFLKKTRKPLESYINALTPVVQDLKDFYDALDPSWHADTGKFLKLMVVDGCFMLHILGDIDYFPLANIDFGDVEIAGIKRDMLILENQLPMLVLVKIDQVRNGGEQREEHIQQLVLRFWGFWSLSDSPLRMGACLHVLDMYRKTLIWDEKQRVFSARRRTNELWSAIELTEAGIRLEAADLISFNINDGVLRIPSLEVNHTTESIFLNLIAFDGLHVGVFRGEVTSYIYFLRHLIKSPRDVRLLISNRILLNGIGSEEAILQLFDSLSKEVPNLNPFTPKMYLDIYEPIMNYRDKRQSKVRAYLAHAYHESTNWSPLAYWSIIAAILLFILSFLQTWFTIYPYYHPRK